MTVEPSNPEERIVETQLSSIDSGAKPPAIDTPPNLHAIENPPVEERPTILSSEFGASAVHDELADTIHELLREMVPDTIPVVTRRMPVMEDQRDEVSLRSELLQLVDLTAKYPEIGPPLAQLAYKIGETTFGNQIVRMGLGKEGPGLEYYFVVANSARREHRYTEARKFSIEAIHAFVRTSDEELASDDGSRLLQLVRLGYSTLLFDEKDPKADMSFVKDLRDTLPLLEPKLSGDAFYHAMVAQTRWYDDAVASERAWDRAAEIDSSESTWNARGTWYKDAERDLVKAERAYRKGLERAPTSPLLLHNLGQLLVDKAELPSTDVDKAHRLLHDADQCLRAALREESPKGLRRHVHSTMDRLASLRSSLPPRGAAKREEAQPDPVREPTVGEVIRGRVRSIAPFGVFVFLPGCGVGLLHKSEIAHQSVDDPGQVLKVDQEIDVKVLDVGWRDGRIRIALSMKALLPVPPAEMVPAQNVPTQTAPSQKRPSDKPRESVGNQGRANSDRPDRRDHRGQNQGQNQGQNRGQNQGQKPRNGEVFTKLGDVLLAKLDRLKKP